mmetsp:Transcript_49463/g.147721  ORF Transcript_49463/g.147721 Transcript_49463/m.147721 type:complete len:246 (-) Transcript_49463:141-878(-)
MEEELRVLTQHRRSGLHRSARAHADSCEHELAILLELLWRLLQPSPVLQDGGTPVDVAPAAAVVVGSPCWRLPVHGEDPALLRCGGEAVEDGGNPLDGLVLGVRIAVAFAILKVLGVEVELFLLVHVTLHANELPDAGRLLVLHQGCCLGGREQHEAGNGQEARRYHQVKEHVLLHLHEGCVPLRRSTLDQVLRRHGDLQLLGYDALVVLEVLNHLAEDLARYGEGDSTGDTCLDVRQNDPRHAG